MRGMKPNPGWTDLERKTFLAPLNNERIMYLRTQKVLVDQRKENWKMHTIKKCFFPTNYKQVHAEVSIVGVFQIADRDQVWRSFNI